MFRKLFACCLRQRSEANEDLIGKPKNMSDARWRARFEEVELVLATPQAEKKALPPSPSFDDVYGEAVGKVNDARVILTAALVHEPPVTVAEEEEEDLLPAARRWRVCRRHWKEIMAANASANGCPRARRAFRPGRR